MAEPTTVPAAERYRLDTRYRPPHVIQPDGRDIGVATPTEEALWAENEQLRNALDRLSKPEAPDA